MKKVLKLLMFALVVPVAFVMVACSGNAGGMEGTYKFKSLEVAGVSFTMEDFDMTLPLLPVLKAEKKAEILEKWETMFDADRESLYDELYSEFLELEALVGEDGYDAKLAEIDENYEFDIADLLDSLITLDEYNSTEDEVEIKAEIAAYVDLFMTNDYLIETASTMLAFMIMAMDLYEFTITGSSIEFSMENPFGGDPISMAVDFSIDAEGLLTIDAGGKDVPLNTEEGVELAYDAEEGVLIETIDLKETTNDGFDSAPEGWETMVITFEKVEEDAA